jgi:hypothetical protein
MFAKEAKKAQEEAKKEYASSADVARGARRRIRTQ